MGEIGAIHLRPAYRGERIVAWCTICGWFRWAIVERTADPVKPPKPAGALDPDFS